MKKFEEWKKTLAIPVNMHFPRTADEVWEWVAMGFNGGWEARKQETEGLKHALAIVDEGISEKLKHAENIGFKDGQDSFKSVGCIVRHTGSLKDMSIIVWNNGTPQPPEGTILYIKKGEKE